VNEISYLRCLRDDQVMVTVEGIEIPCLVESWNPSSGDPTRSDSRYMVRSLVTRTDPPSIEKGQLLLGVLRKDMRLTQPVLPGFLERA